MCVTVSNCVTKNSYLELSNLNNVERTTGKSQKTLK